MAEYTYADIITGKDILTDQVEDKDIIGAKGYFASDLKTIVDSFDDNTFPDSLLEGTVETISYVGRFKRKEDGIYFDYFIRKKEPKYVPFDLMKEEDRARLRGAWVRYREIPNIEKQINGLNATYVFLYGMENQGISPKELNELWEFVDGSPCGKLVEEEI